MLQNGFKGKAYADVRDNLAEYFIVNYFGEADYLGTGPSGVPGHIPGAFQFTPYASLGDTQMLKNLPTDKPIIVYCWTGQHSSQVTAYLNMLGYEAYSLKFGSNNLFYDNLMAHKWSASYDFTLETN
jgi:rhodanese-related sulfurtransferase